MSDASWRRPGWAGAIAASVITVALVAADLLSVGFRHWWEARPLTTTVLGGLLVLLDTVLISDRVIQRRQLHERSQAIAAQSIIVLSQAGRTAHAVRDALTGDGELDGASSELKTYMGMLLTVAPLLIDARSSRAFLEDAQRLGGRFASALSVARNGQDAAAAVATIDRAVEQMRDAAGPLVQILNRDQRTAAAGGEDTTDTPVAAGGR